MSNVIPFDKPKFDPKCSFCGTPQSKVKKMVKSTSSTYAICDKCVEKATQRIKESNEQSS